MILSDSLDVYQFDRCAGQDNDSDGDSGDNNNNDYDCTHLATR